MANAVAISCPTATICFVATGNPGTEHGGILVSRDGGQIWAADKTPQVGDLFSISCPSANVCIAAGPKSNGDPDGVMTTDGGRSWSTLNIINTNAISCADNLHCVVVGSGAGTDLTPYANFTTDGGKTWRSAQLPAVTGTAPYLTSMYFSVACPSASYCVAGGYSSGSYKSVIAFTTDGGSSWSASPTSTSFNSIHSLVCPSVTRCYGVAGTASSNQVIEAAGPGAPWHVDSDAPPVLDMISCPTTSDCVSFEADTAGNAVASMVTDNGWQSIRSTPLAATLSGLPGVTCPSSLWCAALGFSDDRAVLKESTDGGLEWSSSFLPPGSGDDGVISCPVVGDCLVVNKADPTLAWTKGPNGIWTRSVVGDRGFTSEAVTCTTTSMCLIVGSEQPQVNPAEPPQMDQGNPSYAIFESLDSGLSWRRVSLPSPLSTDYGGLSAVSCGGPLRCVASGSSGSMYTVDGGQSWSPIALPYETDPASLSCSSEHVCIGVGQAPGGDKGSPASCPNTHACGRAGGTDSPGEGNSPLVAFVSPNGGESFRRIVIPGSVANSGNPYTSCSSASDCVVMFSTFNASGTAGEVAGYATNDGGNTWQRFATPAALADITGVSCAPGSRSCVLAGEASGEFGLFVLSLTPR